ncbi:hypothetical protein [Azospirillum halopraeferens]|uniref:hypothetical protein n=1 Tax=Azospirillum halopraeferens TaxID=34010 RepID=UPI000409C361|nr:hypothetical protein [Azospirillum halopraeferens]
MAKHKHKGFKIPKKIAGYKVPKRLRKSKALSGMLASPTGRQVMSDVLFAVAGALVTNERARSAVGHAGADAAGVARGVVDSVGNALSEGVRQVLPERGGGDGRPQRGRDRDRRASSH